MPSRVPVLALLLAPVLALCARLPADELRLRDGRVLYGKVTEDKASGTLLVETRDGTVQVAAAEVVEQTADAVLRERLRALAKSAGGTAFGSLQVAMQAHEYGLDAEMWRQLDNAMAAPQRSAAVQSRLDDFLGQLESSLLPRKWRTACTEVRVRELLAKLRRDGGAGQRAALLELLRREPNADKDLRGEARKNSDAERRLLAVEALIARGTAGNDRFAWRTAILDRDAGIRQRVVAAAVAHHADQGAVDYLAPGLVHDAAEVRVRTAEAFANFAAPAAVKLLVLAGPNAGKALAATDNGFRGHVAFLQQQSYIRDFDVEVASASFIADPKVGVLQSGVVLDVTTHGIFEERVRITRAYRGALQRLAGSDPGADPRTWATWLMQREGAASSPTTPVPAPKKG